MNKNDTLWFVCIESEEDETYYYDPETAQRDSLLWQACC